MGAQMISVYLVDDHTMVRAGFRRLLETEDDINIIGEKGCGEDAYPECLALQPDVVVADIAMPGEGGLSFIRRLLNKDESAKVLVMSMHDDETFVSHAIQLGARGYLSKSGDPNELAQAVRSVAKGDRWVSPEIAQRMVYSLGTGNESPVEILTTREFEVFILLSEGNSVIEIGKILHISPKTVNVHRANLMEKLKVKNTVELAHIAIRTQMIQP
ncbi:response regulator transcription factor [Mariprofundus sp. NF]|nr:response regulator transcription factor [Mariprofundus sp. NF]